MPEIKGSCRCGKVTFESSAEPIFTGICHCRNCQKQSGSAFSTVVAVPGPTLTVSGDLKRFDGAGDSGNAVHYDFCPECGSVIKYEVDAMAGVTMLQAGSLDDPSWIRPATQIYCDSAQPWVSLGGEIQSFAKMPG